MRRSMRLTGRLGPQPRGARGTIERPYSALTLRLVLAVFGLVSCAALAVLAWSRHAVALAAALAVLAVVAFADLVVIQVRRRAVRRPPGRGSPKRG